MALINFLKKKKEQIDKAIPDLNVRQRAAQAVRQVGKGISNIERASQQAGLRARQQVNRAAPVVSSLVKEAPKQIASGLLRSGAIAADTGIKALQKGEDIVTAPLGKGYRERLQNLRSRQSATEDKILQRLKPLEQKKGQGLQNYLKDAYNLALPEIKSVKQSTPLQRGAAIADIGLTFGTGGASQVAKQGLKQIAKQYGKTALLQGAGGAAGAATMKDATASDIAKGALAGAVFGTGLKGAGDVTRIATPAITRQVSKAGQKVQTALEQPKFKPGFASTKPKVELKPKQPKTEAKQVPQRAIEKAETIFGNLQDKKAGRNIPGFTPAPEAKTPQATRIQASDLKVKSKVQPTENIVVKSKNASVPSLTEADVNQIARNTKKTPQEVVDSYGALSNRISETSKKPVRNIQASLTSFIRDPKKWDNQFVASQKVLTSERLDIPEPKAEAPVVKLATKKSSEELAREAIGMQDTQKVVRERVFGKEAEIPATPQQKTQFEINQTKRDLAIPEIKSVSKSEAERIKKEKVRPEVPEIDIGRTQAEIDKIIREKVFGKEPTLKPTQPAVKLAKPETFEQTITRVASESAEKAKKQPISPEIAPVARVSGKEDIKVSPEVKIKTRNEQITEASINVKDENTKAVLINERKKDLDRIEADYKKATGKTYEEFKMEHEAGTYTPGTEKLHKQFDKLSDTNLTIAEKRHNVITPKRENYIYHITEENANRILKEGPRKSVGDILYTPGFSKKRTGALKDYTFGKEADLAHFAESIGPTAPEASALFRTANQIKNQVNKSKIVDKDGVIKPISSIKYVKTIKDNIKATAQNKYNDVKKAIIPGVRSVKNRVFQLADKKFYDDFLKPFNNAQRDYNNALQNASKLSNADVKNLAQSLGIKISDKANKDQLLLRIAGEYKKQYYGPATETFMKNVANADIKEPNGLQLLEDIAETYIGSEVRKNKFIDKLSGEIRLGYARGALGLNVGSAINNVLELKKVLSRAGIKNTAGAIKDYMAGVDLRNKYGVATTSNIFQDEAFNLLKKVDPVLFSLFDFSENAKNRLFLSSLEKLGKNKGLQGDDLEYFVLKNFEQYGLAGGRAEDIGLFTGGKRPLTKTAFQFLQYPIKDTVAFADALSNGLKKAVKDKKLNEDLSYAMVYGLTSVGQMAVLSQIIGQKGFGSQTGFTPFDFLKQISSGDVTGPGTDAIIKLGTWVNEIMQPESDKKEENVRKAQTDMNRTFLMGVVPAYNQIWNRTGRYLQDRNRGYFETGSGNVANLVTDDVWGKVRAIILGGSYDPERQKYFIESQKSKSPNLGKQESAIFREVKEKGGLESAKQYFNSIMGKREADKALKSLEEGVNAKKPDGISDEEWVKIKATNEAYILSGLATTDDFINYYARDIEFGKSGSERTKNESKVFKLVNQLNDEDKFKKLSPEQKQEVSNKLLEKAGISKDVVDYYNKSNNSVVVKYQMALEEIEKNLSENPNFDVFNYLAESRRKINTKQFASQDVLKMLEQDGIISKEQYKVLNKMNFLYLDGEFKNRSTAVKLKGSGKVGKKRISVKSLMAGEKRLKDIPKVKGRIPIVKLKAEPKLAAIKLKRKATAPAIKLAPSRKAKPKKLTIRNIRVK